MGTQLDSIDISQLKAFALGLNHDQSDRDSPLSAVVPRSKDHAQADPASLTAPHHELPHNTRLQHLIHTQPWPGGRISGPGIHGQRHPASQPELPSTIPESTRNKMFAIDSQSEGDTQPVSQSVYKEFASRRAGQLASRKEPENHGDPNLEEGVAFQSLHEDETGHIDLLGAFEQPSIIDNENTDADHEDDDTDPLSQAMDVRADPFPESKRFKEPKTPATNDKKRKRGVEDESQENAATPGLPVNPFAGGVGGMDVMMGPSQLFKATQALTSPLTNTVPSDGLSERPSPGMHVLQPPLIAGSLSSPADASRFHTVRAVTEPQTTYVSMKESQEARERYLRSLKAAEILSHDELSDDDFGSADTQLRRRSKQRRIDAEAKNQFAGLKARDDPVIHGHGRLRAGRTKDTPRRVGTHQAGKEASEPVLISDDAPMEDTQGNLTEDETEREEEVQAEDYDDLDELGEENKENVEVPRTLSRAHHTTSQVVTSQPTPSHRNIRTAKRGSQKSRVVHVESSSQNTRSQEPVKSLEGANQPDAIVDSQTSQGRANIEPNSKAKSAKAFSGPQSSLDERVLVPQSQSSQALQATNSSEGRFEGNQCSGILQSSPLLLKSVQDNAELEQGLPRASAGPLQTEGPSGELPKLESTSRTTQEPPASLAPQSNRAEGYNLPMTHVVPHQSTIPETSPSSKQIHVHSESTGGFSNSMPSPRTTPKSVSKAASSHSVVEQSRPSTLFETAQEHLAESPSKLHPQRAQKASQNNQASPIKTRLSRTISEIAADPTPPGVIGDVDVNINILSNEDIEFQNAINRSSPAPARKRRRGGRGLALQVAYQEPNKLPLAPRSPLLRSFNSEPPGSSAISPITPHPTSEADMPSLVATKSAITKQAPAKGGPTPEPKGVQTAKPAVTSSNKSQSSATPEYATRPQALAGRGASIPAQLSASHKSVSSIDQVPANGRAVTAPNRVFAHFNGSNPAYHPATCLEMIGGDDPRYRVRFEDGTVDVIGAYGIKRLELRPGDVVKVDLPGARKLNYVVEGVQDQHVSTIARDPATPSRRSRSFPTNDSAFPETDVYGNATVLMSPKQRLSVDGEQPESSQIAVPLTLVYLTQTMWTAFKDRQYTHLSNKPQTSTGLQTPSERPSTPSTPSSRTRRLKSSGLVQPRSAAIGKISGGGIFSNMAFAITNIDRADENERIKNHVTSSGGRILNTGLDELFHIPALPRTTSPADSNADVSFHLIPAAKEIGFTCLIADKHCRTAKYIQALSLGIPCLSTRWITDCVTKQRLLPWAPYLLAAGESAFLGGAMRSRVLQPFDAETATLSDIVENRPRMLNRASVLIIMEKGQEKSMQQHPLITHALGASKISRAISDASAAKAVADAQALGEPWDWVFSYDREREVEEKLFGGSGTGTKRKRGRDSEYGPPGKKGKTRVVGNEFVIQSLILGMLIEE